MQAPVRNVSGAEVSTIELSDGVFALPMNKPLVYQAVVRQRANARQGTSETKGRSDVSGSGQKPWPQKHTGRARAGDKRSPLWRHGGIVFGPHPRTYRQRLPKKMRRLAIRCMLSDKHRNGNLTILEDLALVDGKTREMAGVLRSLDLPETVLLVTGRSEPAVVQAASNLKRVRTLPAAQLNVGDLVKYRHLVMTVEAVKVTQALWSPEQGAPA